MPAPDGDRNLLFGILAVQMDFVSRDQLLAGMNAWIIEKDKSLGQVLQDQKVLSPQRHALLDALVQEHLKQHGNDPKQSLAAISSVEAVRQTLQRVDDADVGASLAHVTRASGDEPPAFDATRCADPNATVGSSFVGQATSSGMRFRILRPHARGGLGEVHVAQDEELHREVALKQIHDRHADDAESRARFVREAEITGGLEHPGIVPVYGLGTYAGGRPYYAMRFIRGDSLKDAIDRFHADKATTPGERALTVRKLLRRLIDVCNAIAYAHSRGVLHRDLKPGNIMLGKYGETLVVDWGLAKAAGTPDTAYPEEAPLRPQSSLSGTGETIAGSAIGTPQFMSPEQAAGRLDLLGPASDVYSLGATLYVLLTGQAAFIAKSVVDVLKQVQRGEFPKPRQVKADVPAPLEAICLKAMALKPADRYASPRDLADDLERWLADEPVSAWQEPLSLKVRRWLGRHKTLVTATAATLVVGALILAVATVLLAASNRDKELARQAEAEHARNETAAKQDADNARRDAHRQLVNLCGESGLTAARNGDHSLALLWFARAVQLAGDDQRQEQLNRIRAANWLRQVSLPEGTFAIPGFRQIQDRFRSFQFSPDGRYLLVTASTGGCLVWDRPQGRLVDVPGPAAQGAIAVWQPQSGLLAVACMDRRIRLLAPPDFRPVEDLAASGEITVLAFSPDGKRLAMGGSDGARVWDLEKKDYATPVLGHPQQVSAMSFSSRGALLATSARDGKARVFRVPSEDSQPLFPPVAHVVMGDVANRKGPDEDGRPLVDVYGHAGPDGIAPRFVAGDQFLLTVADTNVKSSLIWRSTATGQIVKTSNIVNDYTGCSVFAVSPLGQQVAALSPSKGCLLDAQSGQVLSEIPGTPAGPGYEDVIFSADGKTLVTCGHDTRARFWSVDDRSENNTLNVRHPPISHPMQAVRVCLTYDGRHLAAALWDGTVCLWRLPPPTAPVASAVAAGGSTLPALSPDGRFLLPRGVTYQQGNLLQTRVYEAETGKAAGPVLDPDGILLDAAFSPDGACVATASSTARARADRIQRLFEPDGKGGNVQLWDWKTGKRLAAPIPTPSEPRGLAFNPAGRTLAVVCADYQVILIDPKTATITHNLDPGIRTRPAYPNQWFSNGEARFSPDGRFLVTWETSPHVHVWDPDRGKLLYTLLHNERVKYVAFNPTAPEVLATSGWGSDARIWNLSTGKLQVPLKHPRWVGELQFSPDGTELTTACDDGLLRVWDWKAGTMKDGWALHSSPFWDFRFTADRRWLVTLGFHELQVTDWRTKTPVTPLWHLNPSLNLALAIPAGDRRAIVGGFSGSLVGYDLETMVTPTDAPAEDLLLLAELAAGRRIVSQGSVVPLNSEEWAKRWQRLRRTENKLNPKANDFDPSLARAYFDLATGLRAQKRLGEAVTAYRQAIDFDPHYAHAYNDLGITFHEQKKLPEALAAFSKAVQIDLHYALAQTNVGVVLRDQKKLPEAIAAFNKAIQMDPNYVEPRVLLGSALSAQGSFGQAAENLQNALKAMPQGHRFRALAERLLKQSQEMLALETRLPLVLAGEEPADAKVLLQMARMCLQFKERHVTAVRLYQDAFKADPAVADDLSTQHTYNAACAAVLAGLGRGAEAGKLPAEETARFRKLALAWLQADLDRYAKKADEGKAETAVLCETRLLHWQADADLAGVRDPMEIVKLPQDEVKLWQKLWIDVDGLLKEVRGRFISTRIEGELTAKDKRSVHTCKMVAERVYMIDLESTAFDTFLTLEDPQGKKLAENDDIAPGVNLNSRLIFTAPKDGVYRLVASSFVAGGQGAYVLTIREFRGD